MTKYREILRLSSLGFSNRDIALSVPCSKNTVSKVLKMAQELKLCWPLQDNQIDEALEKLFYPKLNNRPQKRIGIPETLNLADVNVARVGESMTDVTDKNEFVETREPEPVDKADWIVRRISELGGYENVSDSVKADIFGFDIADVSGSIRRFSDVMKKLGMKLDGDELYEEFQRIYDESVDKDKTEGRMWNRGRGR